MKQDENNEERGALTYKCEIRTDGYSDGTGWGGGYGLRFFDGGGMFDGGGDGSGSAGSCEPIGERIEFDGCIGYHFDNVNRENGTGRG